MKDWSPRTERSGQEALHMPSLSPVRDRGMLSLPNPDKPRLVGAGRQRPAFYFYNERGTKICHPRSVTNYYWLRDGGRLEVTKKNENCLRYCFNDWIRAVLCVFVPSWQNILAVLSRI